MAGSTEGEAVSRRARLWHIARESKSALAYAGPEDDDDEGGIDALLYLGPWCCADGQRLAVPVCPECAAVSVAYQEAMGVCRG